MCIGDVSSAITIGKTVGAWVKKTQKSFRIHREFKEKWEKLLARYRGQANFIYLEQIGENPLLLDAFLKSSLNSYHPIDIDAQELAIKEYSEGFEKEAGFNYSDFDSTVRTFLEEVSNIIKDLQLTALEHPDSKALAKHTIKAIESLKTYLYYNASEKIKVFLMSSIDPPLDIIRRSIKAKLEATGVFIVNGDGLSRASSNDKGQREKNFQQSDVCLLLVANNDLSHVQADLNKATGLCKRIIGITANTKSIKGVSCNSVAEINDFPAEAYHTLISDILESYQIKASVKKTGSGISALSFKEITGLSQVKKTYYQGFKNTDEYFAKYILGEADSKNRTNNPNAQKLNNSDLDNAIQKILPTIIDYSPLDTSALDVAKDVLNKQFIDMADIRAKRFEIIKSFYLGNVDDAYQKSKQLYNEVKDNADIPQFLKDDILIDYRNLENRQTREYTAKNIVWNLDHKIIHPEIDRIYREFYDEIWEDSKKHKYLPVINSTITVQDMLLWNINRIANMAALGFYYGSFTCLRMLPQMLEDLLLRLSEKYSNHVFKTQLLKLLILGYADSTDKNIINRYSYIWGYCSQDELGDITRAAIGVPHEDKWSTLKTTIKYLGNFLNEMDYQWLENQLFEYLKTANIGNVLWGLKEIIKDIRFRIEPNKILDYLKENKDDYINDPVPLHEALQVIEALDFDKIDKKHIRFIKDVIDDFYKHQNNNQLEYMDGAVENLVLGIGEKFDDCAAWVEEKSNNHLNEPLFGKFYNSIKNPTNATKEEYLKGLICDTKNTLNGRNKNQFNSREISKIYNLHKELIRLGEISKPLAVEVFNLMEMVLLDNRFVHREKCHAIKVICFLITQNDAIKGLAQKLFESPNIYTAQKLGFNTKEDAQTIRFMSMLANKMVGGNKDDGEMLMINVASDTDKFKMLSLLKYNVKYMLTDNIASGMILYFIVNCCRHEDKTIYITAIRCMVSLLETNCAERVESILIDILRQPHFEKRLYALDELHKTKLSKETTQKIINACVGDNNFVVNMIISWLKDNLSQE